MQKLLTRPLFGAILVFIISFVVYLQTMAPSVPFIDGGELAASCSTLGICHPTGYPLFTMIGWLFAHLPIATRVIVRLNMMSALFTAMGAAAMVYLVAEMFGHWFSFERAETPLTKKKNVVLEVSDLSNPSDLSVAIGIFAGLSAAFSETWWAQSNAIEVYPLHCFLVPIALTFFFRMLRLEKQSFGKNSFLFALTLGLSFANHLTTVLLAPACLYLFFAISGLNTYSVKKVFRFIPAFALGLLPYLYFPIRSSQFPLMDWGHPTNLSSFFKHFSGGQYKIWMFTAEAPAKNWPYFWHEFPTEFSLVGFVLILIGLYALLVNNNKKHIHLLIFVLLLFFGCLFYSINFDILEIDPYFLIAYLACILMISFAGAQLTQWLKERWKESVPQIALILAVLFAIFEGVANYTHVDESGNYMVEDYAMNVLKNLPPHAIVFSTAWDFWLSGAFYYQLVEHIRPDVLVIDAAMLRDRPWYYSYLQQRDPEVMSRVATEVNAFMPHLLHFDRGEPFDQQAIAETYTKLTDALIRKNSDRPIFIAPEMLQDHDPLFAPAYKPIPAGIVFRLLEKDSVFDAPPATIQWNDAHYRVRNYYTDNARMLQATSLASRAQYLLQHGNSTEAKQWLDLALRLKPDHTVNPESLQERDKNAAFSTNERFAQIEQLRRSIK